MPSPDAAQGIEARSAETRSGSVEDESPVDKVDAPPSLPPTGEGLPEEIVKAIDAYAYAVRSDEAGRSVSDTPDRVLKASWGRCDKTRSTLDATILRHLSAARARAERAEGDAVRFQALMRCGRIKMQGSAGVSALTGQRTYPDNPGMVHFGAEFWVEPEAELSPFTAWGRHCLRALADDILAFEAAGRAALSQGEETE